ncbi:hypothetical protein [Epilithonimonas hispanica]|uniref:Uncharacterized protein n=1 Tax=Epilithonimonas hispanica TaxID=358687 RepID=A0A3D9CXE8_9FLAO|nr:hypothetical protein [Epilithonimonas hispanica]REC70414.1 hypothetical protein DRF58_09635 [Epilithonimonas hispanica]
MASLKDATEFLFGVKIDKKTEWIINIFLLIFLSAVFLIMSKYSKKQGELMAEKRKQSQFSGIVDSLYSDKANHAVVSVFFKDGIKKTGFPESYYYAIKKNDSLYKLKNNDTIYLKRGNIIKKLN